MSLTKVSWLLSVILLLSAAITPILAQNAQLGGQVTDPSGAVIQGTTISITNIETGVVRNSVTNDEGYYSVPALQPGHYSLSAQKEGFKRVSRDDIVLRVGDRVTLNLALEIGSATQSVTVTTEVPLLRTEDAQQGLVVDNRRIMELPQYDRNPLAFAQLAPNVNGNSVEAGYGSDFRINGGRTNQAEYYLDGQPVTTGYLHNIPPSVPSKEAVAEFKVVTNGLSAEYGRLSGGVVTLVTRSGTNEFHGSGYEFFKNDALNANDWNSNRLGRSKGVFHDNVFGFTFGGPVTIPKVYKGKDKTFFFLNYEGTRHASGSNANVASVPTDLEKQGDFSQSLINGVPAQIFDPATGVLVNGQVQRQPFSGQMIPQSRFDPLSKIYMGYYPAPNTAPLPGTNNQDNYVFTRSSPFSNNRWTGRLDQNWSSTNSTHFSISQYDYNASTPRAFSALEAVGVNTTTSYTASVEHNWIISPTTFFTFRAGVVRDRVFTGSTVDANDSNWGLPANVINLLGGTNNGRVPSISGAGVNSLGGGSLDDIRDTSYTGSIAVQKVWGKHTFKAGYEHRRYYSNEMTGGNFSVSSDRSVTSFSPSTMGVNGAPFASFLLGKAIWGTGNQMAGPAALQTYHGAYFQDDIKLTNKLTINAGIRWDFEPPRTERYNREVFWDRNYTWNIQPNPGWSWSQVEQVIGMTLPEPVWMSNGIQGRAAMMGTTDYPMQTLEQSHPAHFGPRLGIAYEVLPRTVIRASYGIIWQTKTGNWFLGSARWNVGYGDLARMAQGGTPDGGLSYPLSFSDPMPGGAGYIPRTDNVAALNQSVMGNWWLSESAEFNSGYQHAIQFAIQRELGSGSNTWVAEIAYNGELGRDLPFWLGQGENILPDAYHKIGYLGSNLLVPVPNPFYGQIPVGTARSGQNIPLGQLLQQQPLWSQITTTGDPIGTSNYNAGYVQIEHRFAHGFGFLANYTLSKLMEDCGGIDHSSPGPGAAPYVQAGLGPGDIYSLDSASFRHKAVFNYSVELPFGRNKRFLNDTSSFGSKVLDKIVGGWVAAGVTSLHSGTPLSVVGNNGLWWIAGQATNSGNSERPVFVYPRLQYNNNVSGHSALVGSANYTPYMNSAAFRFAQATPNLLEIGDVPASFAGLISPSFSQWDFSLMKNFGLGKESRYLQLRFEAENLFNHMNAGKPDQNLTSSTFGMITSQNGSPRLAMVAAKIYF